MDKDNTEESVDQPQEEESQDQPEVESEESNDSEDTTETEQTEEEEPQEDSVEIDGEQISVEELKKGYLRQSDYTKKTQELAELRKNVESATKKEENDQKLSPQEKEALATLDRLGVARKEDVEAVVRRMMAQQTILTERQQIQQDTGLDADMMDVVQMLALKKKISLSEAAKLLNQSKKNVVVKRKAVGAQGGVSSSAATRKSGKITPETIRDMDPNSKEFKKVVEMMEKGEL